MKEIEFYFDWDNHKVVFNDGTICSINEKKNLFTYNNVDFTLESDVEKDLCDKFNIRYVNITKY